MAIVKFVSDKDCHVFIDMEFAGKVAPDSMLKVTLETGGYLIQIKDDDGHLIKEYDLEIKASDNQVLQKIKGLHSQIEDVIGELRNDFSLRFYHQRAIFCYNGNYGYINSQYKIAIEPIYSYAENFTNGLALVKKMFPNGEKATIIDVDGSISLDRWYDYIGGNEKTVLLKSEKNFYVLSKADYSIVNQYLDAKYDGKGALIPVHQHIGVDDMYGFIDKSGIEVIPLIYDFAGNFRLNHLASVKRFGEYNAVDLNGNLYRYGIYSYKSKRETEILTKEQSLYIGFSGCYKEGNYWGINSDEEPCWDRIIYNSDSYLVYRKNRICNIVIKGKEYFEFGILNIVKEKNISIEADDIILVFSWDGRPTSECLYLNYIVVRRNWKYGIIDLEKNTILPIDYDYIEPTDAHYSNDRTYSADIAIVWKGEKCSLFNMDNRSFLVPFEYEDIEVNENFDNSLNPIMDSSFLMKKNGKYGLIANDCETVILPFKYDKIFYDIDREWRLGKKCERVILTKDGKMGTWQKYHYYDNSLDHWSEIDVRVDEEYDECVFLKDKNYYRGRSGSICDIAVKRGNKWGVIKYKEKENGDIISNKKVTFKYNSLDEILQKMDCKYFPL